MATIGEEITIIARRLFQYKQRATYGAVAKLVGCHPVDVFKYFGGKGRWNCFIVNESTGEPPNYKPINIDSELFKNWKIISNAEELKKWLQEHPQMPPIRQPVGGQ